MKQLTNLLTLLLVLLVNTASAQPYDAFLDSYFFKEKIPNKKAGNILDYQNITGSPYLNREYSEGLLYLNDTTAAKLPVRFNIYSNEMEYLIDGVAYTVTDRSALKKVKLGNATFIYSRLNGRGSYVEVLVSGKCSLYLKRSVQFKPGEGPKPIVGTATPPEFVKDFDSFFLEVKGTPPAEIKNMKSVPGLLPDKKEEIRQLLKTEKIKRASKENLVRVITYYNLQ